ncbi:hypothetical protein PF008_g754 [Phytophthora fragariae]|uniref:Uncharacterized protein n=1 Tax=Phytophthora fragariae TaxID=53985 RepID=A0A6G0SMN8_9STRA|nr:hypothetical protein PF008_g754 [Phytophthora fragariae]
MLGRVCYWTVCAAGPCVQLDRVCCWTVCAAGPCVLLGRVCCWTVCAAGPRVLLDRVCYWAVCCWAVCCWVVCAGLCAAGLRVLGCVCCWTLGRVPCWTVRWFAPVGCFCCIQCDLPAPMELVRQFGYASKTQEWRKGVIGRWVDDFAFVVALTKLVKEDGKMACFVERPHGFDDRANGCSL